MKTCPFSSAACLPAGLTRIVILLALMAACLSISHVALAQQSPRATSEESSSTLEEVVVTARKRSEDLQSTPVSVTAISAAQAEQENIRDFQGLAGFVPSLQVTPQPGGGADLTIRGLGQAEDRVNQDVKTGLYINDMYVAKQEGNYLSFFDVDSLQILKGPQGTLFGKNTTGGAILLSTVLPSNDNSGYIRVQGGNYDRINTEGATNIPINDQLFARVSFRTQNEDGFVNHVMDSGTSNNINDQSVRAQIRWLPGDKLTVDFLSEFNNSKTDGQTAIVTACNDNAYFTSNFNATHAQSYCSLYPVIGRPNTVYGGATLSIPTDSIQTGLYTGGDYVANGVTREGHLGPFANAEVVSENLRINYALTDTLALKSVTTVRRSEFADYDPTENAPQDIYAEYDASATTQITQEFDLTGNALGDRLKYVGGLYYFLQKTNWTEDTGPDWADPTGFLWYSTNRYTSYAGFGQASYKILPELELTVGGRYTRDQKTGDSFLNFQTNYGSPCATFVAAFVAGVAACNSNILGADSDSWSSFDPRGQLSYQITPDIYVYASVSKGYNAGGFNQELVTYLGGKLLAYNPEHLVDYEGGFKTEWADHTVRFNLTAFWQNYSQIQTNVHVTLANGSVFGATQTGASAVERGVEAEFVYAPTRYLKLWANGSLLDQYYTHVDADVANTTINTPVGTAPKYTYSVGAAYTMHLAGGQSVTPSVNWRALGRQPSCSYGGVMGSCYLPAYGLLGSRIDFKWSDDSPWVVSLWGTNLLNATVELNAANDQVWGTAFYYPGRPREFGGEITRHF